MRPLGSLDHSVRFSRAAFSNRLLITRQSVVSLKFKVLLFPHQSSETLPLTSWNTDETVASIDLRNGYTDQITFDGTRADGDLGTAGKTTITGNYVLGASGTLAVDIGGTTVDTAYQNNTYDTVFVSGTTTFAGALAIRLINGFTPLNTPSFTVLSSTGTLSGTFGQRVTTPGGEGTFLVTQTGNTVVLSQYLNALASCASRTSARRPTPAPPPTSPTPQTSTATEPPTYSNTPSAPRRPAPPPSPFQPLSFQVSGFRSPSSAPAPT